MKIKFNDYMKALSFAKKKEFDEGKLFKVETTEKGEYTVVERKEKPKIKKTKIDIEDVKRKMFGDLETPEGKLLLLNYEASKKSRKKNVEWKNTYCNEESGNVRYLSSARRAINGWSYIFTLDNDYVSDLSFHRKVQVKENETWIDYQGYIPEEIGGHEGDRVAAPDEWIEGYDY